MAGCFPAAIPGTALESKPDERYFVSRQARASRKVMVRGQAC